MASTKLICTACGEWTGTELTLDKVKDPASEKVWGVCPFCRTPENFMVACTFPMCWNVSVSYDRCFAHEKPQNAQ